jgi:hypothetical protein
MDQRGNGYRRVDVVSGTLPIFLNGPSPPKWPPFSGLAGPLDNRRLFMCQRWRFGAAIKRSEGRHPLTAHP